MSTFWRSPFKKDLLILFIVSALAVAMFSSAVAWVADRYFGKAINGLMGEYGEYDILLQVRSDALKEARTELERLIGERLPGTAIKAGPSLVGKSTLFLALPEDLRRRDILEGMDALLSRVPGWSGFTLLVEPRLTISAVHGGAQELLIRRISNWEGVDFAFVRGGNLEIVLKHQSFQRQVSAQIKKELKRYRLVELRFPAGYTMEDALSAGGEAVAALQKKAGRGLVRDVTLAGGGDDYEYLMGTMIEMKRFLGYYAAVVEVGLTGDQETHRGDQLVLQGPGRPLITGDTPTDQDVVVRIEQVAADRAQGIIIRGDSREVAKPEAYILDSSGRVGRFVGMADVRSQRDQLLGMLDESSRLLGELNDLSPEAAGFASTALEKMLGYSRLLEDARAAREELIEIREGLGSRDAAIGQARLDNALRKMNRASSELARLGSSVGSLKTSVIGMSDLAAKFQGFNSRFSTISRFLPMGDSIERLLSATQVLAAVSESISAQQDSITQLADRLEEPLAAVEYWRERTLGFQSDYGEYRELRLTGGEGRRQLDDLIRVSGRTIDTLAAVDPAGATGALQGLASGSMSNIDVAGLSSQLAEIRSSLPNLRDEEIGRSITVIEQYVGDQAYAGEKFQILTDQTLPIKTVSHTAERTLGREVSVVTLPVGAVQPDLRGEVFKVLGQVRTTLAALLVVVLGIVMFLLDQTIILSMLRRQSAARALPGGHRLQTVVARLASSPHLYGALVGTVWFPATFALAGAEFPLIGLWGASALGALVGLFFSAMSERFNAVNGEEVMAGQALGLPLHTIMREIVIPAGRPGLAMMLNRRKIIMR